MVSMATSCLPIKMQNGQIHTDSVFLNHILKIIHWELVEIKPHTRSSIMWTPLLWSLRKSTAPSTVPVTMATAWFGGKIWKYIIFHISGSTAHTEAIKAYNYMFSGMGNPIIIFSSVYLVAMATILGVISICIANIGHFLKWPWTYSMTLTSNCQGHCRNQFRSLKYIWIHVLYMSLRHVVQEILTFLVLGHFAKNSNVVAMATSPHTNYLKSPMLY